MKYMRSMFLALMLIITPIAGNAYTPMPTFNRLDIDSNYGLKTPNSFDPSKDYVPVPPNNFDPSKNYVPRTPNSFDPSKNYVPRTPNSFDPSKDYVLKTPNNFDPSKNYVPAFYLDDIQQKYQQDLLDRKRAVTTELGKNVDIFSDFTDGDSGPGFRIGNPLLGAEFTLDTMDFESLYEYDSIGPDEYANRYRQGLVSKSPLSMKIQSNSRKKWIQSNSFEWADRKTVDAVINIQLANAKKDFVKTNITRASFNSYDKFDREYIEYYSDTLGSWTNYLTSLGLNAGVRPTQSLLNTRGYDFIDGKTYRGEFEVNPADVLDGTQYSGIYSGESNKGPIGRGLGRLVINLQLGINSIELLIGDILTGGTDTTERIKLIQYIQNLDEERRYSFGRKLYLLDVERIKGSE